MPTPVACSPPAAARSPALPIGSARASPTAARSLVARVSCDGTIAVAERRSSEDGTSPLARPNTLRFSLSGSLTSRSLSLASTGNSAARPPPGPKSAAKAARVLVGFEAPQDSRAPPPGHGPLSPGRRDTKPSLLSMALSDAPSGSGSLTFPAPLDLFGAASPAAGFLSYHQDAPPEPDMSPLNALVPQHPVLDAPVVRAAYAVAARAHAGQTRKSGEPVLAHCLATAVILAGLGLPEETVAAGLLHDVISDTSMTAWQLEEHVPRSCVELVEKVTQLSDLSQLYRDNTHSLEAAAILDMLTSMSDVGALLIKLADRLHNMRTIGTLARCKQVRMASETLEVFAVLANRLGAWSVKAELEDLAFKTLQPEDYEQLSSAISARSAAIDLPARVAQVKEALVAGGLEVVDVSGRVKNVYGVWKKLRSAGLAVDQIDQVYDVAALRVVVPHKHDCYRALRVVEGLWAAVPGRFKDYVRNRKGNGYQSLHTSVLAAAGAGAGAGAAAAESLLEVQIRTPKMHYIAEYGFAAHWRYKEKLPREDLWLDRLVQWKKWVAAEKLRIRDAKVRADGSSQRDAALAGLIDAAQAVQAAAATGGQSQQQQQPQQQQVDEQQQQQPESPSASSSSVDLDARFMARFSIRPVSEADLQDHSASILISGPRGVRIADVPARCTLAQLLASGVLSEAESRGCSLQLNGCGVPVLARREVRLKPGDHVSLVAEANPVPRPPAPAMAGSASPGRGGPGLLALEVFMPGQAAPMEVSLRQKLSGSTSRLRQAALVL